MHYLNRESKKQNSNRIELKITKKPWPKNRSSADFFIARVSENEERWTY